MSASEEAHWVAEWTRRFRRKMTADRIDLPERAATLAGRYALPRPTSIRWVDGMRTRWGSCTPSTGAIRLSSALAPFPDWVIDYVIVHELAHLREGGHDAPSGASSAATRGPSGPAATSSPRAAARTRTGDGRPRSSDRD
jgi:hypothetical protein